MAAAITAFRAAQAASDRHGKVIEDPAWEALRQSRDAIPHRTTASGFEYRGTVRHMSTDRASDVGAAQAARRAATGDLMSEDYARTCAELRGLIEWREAEEVRARHRLNINSIAAESNRLSDASGDALYDVENFPVATIADLIAKVELIEETDGQVDIEVLLRDLRRLAGEAAA
ncbi:hypothetical protein [Sphingobium scionense]|uniref:Uncharacterized protein n=1 Tax=Sphingobium scionense TaxID=1404341 RepID=A0A7W6LSS1_9SPHN|nr:hypothetical protein [Sphingobium scionense]MBB4149799.1 hypothetical protein [Sphingobium scionense]